MCKKPVDTLPDLGEFTSPRHEISADVAIEWFPSLSTVIGAKRSGNGDSDNDLALNRALDGMQAQST
jgi:hypothetical protein